MDLGFSPDWHAWICYLIVLFFGVLTGWREVLESLADTSGVWRQPAAWALMFILAIGPVLLFWLLDRVGALHDTSVIAAAIVGVSYSQILKGDDSQYKAPASTSPIWNFLAWWRGRIADAVKKRVAGNTFTFDKIVCEKFADPATLPKATALSLKLTGDPVAFQGELTAERDRLAKVTPALGADVIDYKIARLVYREILAVPDNRALMVADQLVDQQLVDKYFSNRRSSWTAGLILAAIIGVAVAVAASDGARWVERLYLVNRLTKPTGTVADLDRVATRLTNLVFFEKAAKDNNVAAMTFWLDPMVDSLRDSSLPMTRIDAVLQILLAARSADGTNHANLAQLLIPTLRNGNVDARRRVQLALVYLSDGREPAAAKELRDWNPTEGDSITEIERRIDAWRRYWLQIRA